MDILELVGVAGFLAYISAYALLQGGYLEGRSLNYTLLNLTGATLVLFSLMDKFNLGSALIQISWIAVSLWGLGRLFVSRSTGFRDGDKDPMNTGVHPSKFQAAEQGVALAYLRSLRGRLKLCLQIRKERAVLRELGQDQLADIGIEKAAAEKEANKSWTDVPVSRLRDEQLMQARKDVFDEPLMKGFGQTDLGIASRSSSHEKWAWTY